MQMQNDFDIDTLYPPVTLDRCPLFVRLAPCIHFSSNLRYPTRSSCITAFRTVAVVQEQVPPHIFYFLFCSHQQVAPASCGSSVIAI